MKQIERQKSNIEKLVELTKNNPDLIIVPMVDYEVCGGDEFSTWLGSWGTPKIDEIHTPEFDEERIYFKSNDLDTLGEKIFNILERENSSWSDKELDKKTEEALSKIEWEKVIVVNINLP